MPRCPVNQRVRPSLSNTAVLRFALGRSAGSGNRLTSVVTGSTRTIALRPPSVTHGAPSGPTMTPCGADLAPSLTALVTPNLGSSHPSSPESCAVYQTPPSRAGATSCGPWPLVTGYSCRTKSAVARVADGAAAVALGVGAGDAVRTTTPPSIGRHPTTTKAITRPPIARLMT